MNDRSADIWGSRTLYADRLGAVSLRLVLERLWNGHRSARPPNRRRPGTCADRVNHGVLGPKGLFGWLTPWHVEVCPLWEQGVMWPYRRLIARASRCFRFRCSEE